MTSSGLVSFYSPFLLCIDSCQTVKESLIFVRGLCENMRRQDLQPTTVLCVSSGAAVVMYLDVLLCITLSLVFKLPSQCHSK